MWLPSKPLRIKPGAWEAASNTCFHLLAQRMTLHGTMILSFRQSEQEKHTPKYKVNRKTDMAWSAKILLDLYRKCAYWNMLFFPLVCFYLLDCPAGMGTMSIMKPRSPKKSDHNSRTKCQLKLPRFIKKTQMLSICQIKEAWGLDSRILMGFLCFNDFRTSKNDQDSTILFCLKTIESRFVFEPTTSKSTRWNTFSSYGVLYFPTYRFFEFPDVNIYENIFFKNVFGCSYIFNALLQ